MFLDRHLRNPTTASGWQVFPEFVVTQGARGRGALQALHEFFGCGRIYRNRRYDNHNEDVFRYCVRSLEDLRRSIIPFFQRNELRTAKAEEFKRFVQVVQLMEERRHLSSEGLEQIRAIAGQMNVRPRISVSSETVRRAPCGGEDTVRASGRPEEVRRKPHSPAPRRSVGRRPESNRSERNSLSGKFRRA